MSFELKPRYIVIVETPFAGKTEEERIRNVRYARACMADCLNKWEAPYASHLLYTQPGVLDDASPSDRQHGMQSGFLFRDFAEVTAVYTDLGTSKGMQAGIDHAIELQAAQLRVRGGSYMVPVRVHRIEYRSLGENWDEMFKRREARPTRWPLL